MLGRRRGVTQYQHRGGGQALSLITASSAARVGVLLANLLLWFQI
jgi:hypothetical protein